MSIIEINGIPVNCVISFEQKIEINHDYVVQTLDYKKHAKFGSVGETLKMTLAPRTPEDNDKIWDELKKPNDYILIKYPENSSQLIEKEFIIYSISRPLLSKSNNIFRFGTIDVEYEER